MLWARSHGVRRDAWPLGAGLSALRSTRVRGPPLLRITVIAEDHLLVFSEVRAFEARHQFHAVTRNLTIAPVRVTRHSVTKLLGELRVASAGVIHIACFEKSASHDVCEVETSSLFVTAYFQQFAPHNRPIKVAHWKHELARRTSHFQISVIGVHLGIRNTATFAIDDLEKLRCLKTLRAIRRNEMSDPLKQQARERNRTSSLTG